MEKQFLKEKILAASGLPAEHIEKVFNAFLQKVSEVLKVNQTIRIDNIGLFQLRTEPVSRLGRDAQKKSKEILIYKNIKGSESEEKNLFLTIEIEPELTDSSVFNESVFNLSIDEPSTIFDEGDSALSGENDSQLEEDIQNGVKDIIAASVILDGYELFNAEENLEASKNEELHDLTSESFENTDNRKLEELISHADETDESSVDSPDDMSGAKSPESILEIKGQDLELSNNESLSEKKDDESPLEVKKKSPFDELAELINKDKSSELESELAKESEAQATYDEIKSSIHQEESNSKRWIYLSVAGVFIILLIAIIYIATQPDEISPQMQAFTQEPAVKQSDVADQPQAEIDSSAADSVVTSETSVEEPLLKEEPKVIEKKVAPVKLSKTEYTGLYRKIENDVSLTDQIYFDGKKYSVQLSSWKSKSFAEHEVKKYKKLGHDAFIYTVYIKSKESTWNRVRIGYFDSQKEAQEFLNNNKL